MRLSQACLAFALSAGALLPGGASAAGGCEGLDKGFQDKVGETQSRFADKDRVILFIIPGGKPETTPVELPKGTGGIGASIPKETLEKLKAAAAGGGKMIVWNRYAHGPSMFVPYGSAEEMRESFEPGKDCSPRAPRLRPLGGKCNLVDLSDFHAGATLLYDDSAEKCKRLGEMAGIDVKTGLSMEEQREYARMKRELAELFGAKTGERRSPGIDEKNTRVAGKNEPRLPIGSSGNLKKTAGGLGREP